MLYFVSGVHSQPVEVQKQKCKLESSAERVLHDDKSQNCVLHKYIKSKSVCKTIQLIILGSSMQVFINSNAMTSSCDLSSLPCANDVYAGKC